MAEEREIPTNCLGNTFNARCVKVGVNLEEYDIKEGDNLDYALSKLGSSGQSNEETPVGVINSNLYCLGGSGFSACASQITSRTMNYSLVPNSSGQVSFSWDLQAVTQGIPQGFSVSNIDVVANNSTGNLPLISSSSPKASAVFNVSSYPITVDIRVRIQTTCGQIELTKTLSLTNTADSGSKSTVMNLNDYTGDSIQDLDQDGFNELAASEICQLKDEVGVLKSTIDELLQRVNQLEQQG